MKNASPFWSGAFFFMQHFLLGPRLEFLNIVSQIDITRHLDECRISAQIPHFVSQICETNFARVAWETNPPAKKSKTFYKFILFILKLVLSLHL